MKRIHLGLAAALLVGIGIGYILHRSDERPSTTASAPSNAGSSGEKKALYWYDPMAPTQHFDKPGKSPFMDMQLVPKYADKGSDASTAGGVSVDARMVQNLGVRIAPVERGILTPAISVVGTVAYDDNAVEVVQARARGYLGKVYVRKPLTPVKRGEALADLIAPEWTSAQAEYLALRGMSGTNIEHLRAAARQRLTVLGLPDVAIQRLDRTGAGTPRVTLVAPRDGVISELDAREGQAVEPGMPLFRINGLATVWVNADVPEAQTSGLSEGAPVSVSVSAFPGRTFDGSVSAILPQVDPMTRTLRARIELPNLDGVLAPGMFAQVAIEAPAGASQLLVPSEAVIRTGERSVVIVASSDSHFQPVEVKTGAEANGKTAILQGLEDGARVVVSGQFLIDSEASLTGTLTRLQGGESEHGSPATSGEAATHEAASTHERHLAQGTATRIDGDRWTIASDAIPSMAMEAMSMTFVCPQRLLHDDIRSGQRVSFSFFRNANGEFEIEKIAVIARAGDKPASSDPGGSKP